MASPATSNDVFTHEPLPDPAKYMRLLEVLDDDYSKTTKVSCRLTTWPIDSMPPYHAISYTWGDPKSNTLILMNDKILEVRTNCEFALKQAYWYRRSQSLLYRKRKSHLYRETRSEWYTESRYFWVDALCIDQSNDPEKSKQVAMMGSIYQNASHVLSCIGDHADDSLFLFESLYGLGHYLVRPRDVLRHNRSKPYRAGFSLRFRMLHRHTSLHRFGLALARLAVRPYFTRVWILQEVQLSRQLTILCGQNVLSGMDALHLFEELHKNLDRVVEDDKSRSILFTPHLNFIGHRFLRRHVNHGFPHPVWHGSWLHELPKSFVATIGMLMKEYGNVRNDLFKLLDEVVDRLQCQDPRDKAYGIISLIGWHYDEVAPLEPDYTLNHLQVAVKFIEKIMELGQPRRLNEPIWKFVILIVKLFNLNIDSPGLREALEARRSPTGYVATGDCQTDTEGEIEAAKKALEGPKIGLECCGWCLSPEDIDKNKSRLQDLEATPPRYPDNDALYLPRWAEADDWVIELEHITPHDVWYGVSDFRYKLEPNYIPLLVLGKGIEGRRKARIGYGFYSPLKQFHSPGFKQDDSAKVSFYFDIEDSIIFLWKMRQLYEMNIDSKDWMIDFLDTDVSKQQIPGPSYAALPSEPPKRSKRFEPRFGDSRFWRSRDSLRGHKDSNFVLFDTNTRRGWFVNGQVVVLELLCAYLKNIPQTEPFDFSKLNYIEDRSSKKAFKVLGDDENLKTPIYRVLKDSEGTPGGGEPLQGQAKVQKTLIVDVLREIYLLLPTMDPLHRFPGDMDRFALIQVPVKKRRNVVSKGWDFDRIYRTGKAKVYTHVFEKDPGWLEFAKDAQAGIIFGKDFGEMLLPRDEDCCPYFKIVPKGEDYLAVGMDRIQVLIDKWTGLDEKDKIVARLTHWYAWERGVEPFHHLHGYDEHLEKVDCRCFPVQTLAKVPHFHTQKKDMAILKRSRGRLYSSQDVEDMNVAVDDDTSESAGLREDKSHGNRKLRKTGVIVFGNRPDARKVKQLAQANESEVQSGNIALERRNSNRSEITVVSEMVRFSRCMRASDERWARWRGKEYPTINIAANFQEW